jgi:hypothetical protein
MKVLVALLIVAGALYLAAIKYAAVESRLQCAGMFMSSEGAGPALADLKLHRYRWWAALWRGSEGHLWIEMPEQSVDAFAHVDEAGDLVVFFDDEKKIQGTFSLTRGALNLETPRGLFGGTCVRVATATHGP